MGDDNMVRVTIDEDLERQILNAGSAVEFLARDGRVIGRFEKVERDDVDPMHYCPYTEQELEAMMQDEGGRPLEDIWRDLGRR
jgi:hypothetical protein